MTSGHRTLPHRRCSGSAIIEMSLLLPVMISLFLGVLSLGYSNHVYVELEQAVRAGARYASHGVYRTASPSTYFNAVKNAAVYGDPAGGSTPVVPNLTPSMVQVAFTPSTGSPVSVTVKITGYRILGPFGTRITLSNKPTLTLPFMGYYVPL